MHCIGTLPTQRRAPASIYPRNSGRAKVQLSQALPVSGALVCGRLRRGRAGERRRLAAPWLAQVSRLPRALSFVDDIVYKVVGS